MSVKISRLSEYLSHSHSKMATTQLKSTKPLCHMSGTCGKRLKKCWHSMMTLQKGMRGLCYCKNYISACLIYHRVHRLTWHGGVIPEDEIWVKLGGDKGGGSFKMSFQICNVLHPNSPNNTCVFCAYEAPDNPSNLRIALERYCDQVNSLESKTWR